VDRRKFASCIPVAIVLGISGCENEPKPSPTATLSNNEEVHAAMMKVSSAADNLGGEVDRFNTDDWREVVPDVEALVQDLQNAVHRLRAALGYGEK
jgi:hypothetical protein